MKSVLTVANLLTLFRIVLVPVFIYLLLQPEPWIRRLSLVVFTIASLTDFLDGYIARKYNQESDLGRFLDPLADKILVIGALLVFLALSEQVQIWMVLCISGRDILITLLRLLARKRGIALKTSMFGKIKTFFQMFSIVVVMLSFMIVSYQERDRINHAYLNEKENYGLGNWKVASQYLGNFWENPFSNTLFSLASFIPYYLMLFTTILTIISGLRYLWSNYELLLPSFSSPRKTNNE